MESFEIAINNEQWTTWTTTKLTPTTTTIIGPVKLKQTIQLNRM